MDGLMSLISSTEFAGFKVKEWNIVQFSKLSAVVLEIANEYKAKNLSWEDFSQSLSVNTDGGVLNISQSVLDMLQPFMQRAPLILSISCKVSVEELEKLSYTDGIVLLLLVLKVNMEHLSRFFVQLVAPGSSTATITASSQP